MYDLIIIGGGPAGITAGIYAARQKLNSLLITKNFGGQITRKSVAIENYPGFEKISGMELIKKFKKQLRKQKIDVEIDEVIKLKKIANRFSVLTSSRHKFEARTIIVATGAAPRPLKVPGEKKFIGRGVSYCPVCDAPLFLEKTVAVIGGGISGLETAIFLSKLVKKIYILEYSSEIKADTEIQKKAKKTGKVEIITDANLKKIGGNQFVNFIVYQDRKTGKDIKLKVEGVFVEIGSQPATSFVKSLVDFNKKDQIIVTPETCQTKTAGLFAPGDVNVGSYRQIVTACGEGAKAALAAYDYLEKLKNERKL